MKQLIFDRALLKFIEKFRKLKNIKFSINNLWLFYAPKLKSVFNEEFQNFFDAAKNISAAVSEI